MRKDWKWTKLVKNQRLVETGVLILVVRTSDQNDRIVVSDMQSNIYLKFIIAMSLQVIEVLKKPLNQSSRNFFGLECESKQKSIVKIVTFFKDSRMMVQVFVLLWNKLSSQDHGKWLELTLWVYWYRHLYIVLAIDIFKKILEGKSLTIFSAEETAKFVFSLLGVIYMEYLSYYLVIKGQILKVRC